MSTTHDKNDEMYRYHVGAHLARDGGHAPVWDDAAEGPDLVGHCSCGATVRIPLDREPNEGRVERCPLWGHVVHHFGLLRPIQPAEILGRCGEDVIDQDGTHGECDRFRAFDCGYLPAKGAPVYMCAYHVAWLMNRDQLVAQLIAAGKLPISARTDPPETGEARRMYIELTRGIGARDDRDPVLP